MELPDRLGIGQHKQPKNLEDGGGGNHLARAKFIGQRSDQGLGQSPHQVLDRQGKRKGGDPDLEALGNRRLKQAETLPHAHGQKNDQTGAKYDEVVLFGHGKTAHPIILRNSKRRLEV